MAFETGQRFLVAQVFMMQLFVLTFRINRINRNILH